MYTVDALSFYHHCVLKTKLRAISGEDDKALATHKHPFL